MLGLLAVALGLLGVVFLVGSQAQPGRMIVGVVLLLAAGALVYLARAKPQIIEKRITQQIHLSGDVEVKDLRCRQCAANLEPESVSVRAGAVFVDCGYCKASYQLEEAPKW